MLKKTFVMVILLLSVGYIYASVPNVIAYQGKLLAASSGQPVSDGSYDLTFRFYDAENGGNLLLTDQHSAVNVKNGLYNVMLGGGTVTPGMEPNLLSVFKNHSDAWLSVQVESDSEMSPRQRISSSGYAINSDTVDGMEASELIAEASPCELYKFVGITVAKTQGNAHWKAMIDMCKSEYGDSVRMCTTEEIMKTPAGQWPTSLDSDAWVQPVIVEAEIPFIIDFSLWYEDNPDNLTCRGWNSNSASYRGMVLYLSGWISTRQCDQQSAITCCVPYE